MQCFVSLVCLVMSCLLVFRVFYCISARGHGRRGAQESPLQRFAADCDVCSSEGCLPRLKVKYSNEKHEKRESLEDGETEEKRERESVWMRMGENG